MNNRLQAPILRVKRRRLLLRVSGLALVLIAALALLEAGLQLGRTFGELSSQEAATGYGSRTENSYPCGPDIACFEKGRYQPIWL
jgi:hypothetical protein